MFHANPSLFWEIPLVLAALSLAWGWISSGFIIKMPPLPIDFNPQSFGYAYETFCASAVDGVDLEGWFVPAKVPTEAAVVIQHGWGATRGDVVPLTIGLAEDFNLFYFDFRNHGRSGGKQTSLTCLEIRDMEAIVRYAKDEKPRASRRLGVMGYSMGAAVAISGAAKIPEVEAVAVESPFTTYNGIVYRYAKLFYYTPFFLVPLTLMFARFRLGFDPNECSPVFHIAKISPRPVLIIQGQDDRRMPVIEGKTLYETAKEPKEIWIVPGATHINSRERNPAVYDQKVRDFFKKWLKT